MLKLSNHSRTIKLYETPFVSPNISLSSLSLSLSIYLSISPSHWITLSLNIVLLISFFFPSHSLYLPASFSFSHTENIIARNFHAHCFCLKKAIPGLFSFIFSYFQYTVDRKQMFNININFWRWLDSNRGPLVSEATALLTEPQPLPFR